jgi:predicted acylesterase/phospholipase RssA
MLIILTISVLVTQLSDTNEIQLMRTYIPDPTTAMPHKTTFVCEALLATIAYPTFFPSVHIHGHKHIGGGLRQNNCIDIAMDEGRMLCTRKAQDEGIGIAVSLGGGKGAPMTIIPKSVSTLYQRVSFINKHFVKHLSDPEQAHQDAEIRTRAAGAYYYRLNPYGLERAQTYGFTDAEFQTISEAAENFLRDRETQEQLLEIAITLVAFRLGKAHKISDMPQLPGEMATSAQREPQLPQSNQSSNGQSNECRPSLQTDFQIDPPTHRFANHSLLELPGDFP